MDNWSSRIATGSFCMGLVVVVAAAAIDIASNWGESAAAWAQAIGAIAAFGGVLYVHWDNGKRQRDRDRQLAAPKATMIYRDIKDVLQKLEGFHGRIQYELRREGSIEGDRQGLVDLIKEKRVPRLLERFIGEIGEVESKVSSELAHVLADAYQLEEVAQSIGTCFDGEAVNAKAESKFLARISEAVVKLLHSIKRALPLLRPYTSLAPTLLFPEPIQEAVFGTATIEVSPGKKPQMPSGP